MNNPGNNEEAAPLIELIDVTVGALRHPRQVVVDNVNWAVAPGDYWAVAGLHNSGKSDFLALLAGLMPPQRGTYRLFGRVLQKGFLDEMLLERMRVGLVFDGGQLLNHLSLAENIALPLQYHRPSAKVAEVVGALLEWTQLEPWADLSPGAISRGGRQRAGLARALVLQPEVLLLDNPLAGLDPTQMIWWLNALNELASGHALLSGKPMTLVVTADDLRPWRARARSFAMLKNRELTVLGRREDLTGQTEIIARDLLPREFGGS